ncbi:MAG: hypothetical protein IJI78_06160 [Oscillospiraceae bacterium]|nr:hypothetical protein [Oscillospiraceae bacterium]
MKKWIAKLKTFFQHFLNDDLTKKEYVWGVLVIFALKLILVCMQMIQIFPGEAEVDDELMFYAAKSIGRGEWLGAYSWATIAKSMGFSVWLWLLHVLHIPYLIGNQLLYGGACVLSANALSPVMEKRRTRFLLIFILWFSPFATAQFTLRVYRDSILPALILYAFAGVIGFCMRVRSDWRSSARYAIAGGLFTGFSRLVRDDVIWIYPFVICATITYVLFVLLGKDVDDRIKKVLSTVLSVAVFFAIPVLLFCAMNLKYYGVFLINESSDKDFTAAISAMQRADMDLPHPGIAVCHDTRDKLYAAVPEMAELGKTLDNGSYYHGYGWQDQEEFNSGGFFWAVRRAAFDAGLTTNGKEAKEYYRSLAEGIEKAFAEGKLEGNKNARTVSAFLIPYDSSFLTPTIKELWNSSKCILFFEQTSSLAPLSYANMEQTKEWWIYTLSMPSFSAKVGTDEADYYFPQRVAEWIYCAIRWCYRIAIWPALILCGVLFFKETKKSLKGIREFFSMDSSMNVILILGVSLSILVRVVLMSYIEVTNFRIGTYLLYLSGAAVLVILIAAVGAAYGFERYMAKRKGEQKGEY